MSNQIKTYCWRSGEIEFSDQGHVPAGALEITVPGMAGDALKQHVITLSRHGYQEGVYLVPGVPEATAGDEALAALLNWQDYLREGVAA